MMKKAGKVLTVLAAAAFGFLVGVSFPVAITPTVNTTSATPNVTYSAIVENVEAANPQGSERRLPPGIVVSQTDLHLRRLWGSPRHDSATRKYLLALAVGYDQKANVDATIKKFSNNFDIVLFHYDGHTTEWDEFKWPRQVTHVSAMRQTEWWFAKRFLHPNIVAPYDYIFLWDEDLGVENFASEAYFEIVRKHGLEISQPGLDATKGATWYNVTARRNGSEMHRFVEVMVPVFSRDAWRCVWHMIQNDFVDAWGLDSNFGRCVHDPQEQIGIVDAQYVVHHAVPTLQNQVRGRQFEEMRAFRSRISSADKELVNRTSSIRN